MYAIAIGSDHAGYPLKAALADHLASLGHTLHDYGTFGTESTDYPSYAQAVGNSVAQGVAQLGIVVCGSGQGVCIAANKVKRVRAGVAWNEEIATLLRQHNDANVLCLAARFTAQPHAFSIVQAFLSASFQGGKHQRRVEALEC